MTDENKGRNRNENNQLMVAELSRFATFKELRRSDVYRKYRTELDQLFDHPKVYECDNAKPRIESFLRVVEWNIERGSRLEGIISVLNSHPVLRFADLLLLNELDTGMVRSANINVALELGRAISAHAIYGVEYLEMTKGVGEELNLPGENTDALHGNAILTRHSFSNPRIVRLPRCENNFESAEKRLGGRIGIIADLEIAGMKLTATTTHLDVVNTPRCRAKQMRAFLQYVQSRVEDRGEASPKILTGGDLNTHTFARGGPVRTARNVVRIFASDQEKLALSLLRPERQEPAIREFARFGFETDAFNDRAATSRTVVSNLNDASRLPDPIRKWVMKRTGPSGILLEFRLDWLAAKGLRALEDGEIIDTETGAASIRPQTFSGLTYEGAPISDHDPIVVDVAITCEGMD